MNWIGRTSLSVLCEIENSRKVREILGNHVSWTAVERVEETLRKRQALIEKKRRELKHRLLDQHSLSDRERLSIIVEILDLDRSRVEVVTARITDLGFAVYPETISSDWFFVAEYTDYGILWRAIQTHTAQYWDEDSNLAPATREEAKQSDFLMGIDKDSLSHFQNCPVPPFLSTTSWNHTQNRFTKMLTNGCFVSITPRNSDLTASLGGIIWKESKKRCINAVEHYIKFPAKHLMGLSSSFTDFVTSSESTQRLQRKPYQLYSKSTDTSLKAGTLKRSNNSFFCSFLSSFEERSDCFIYGEID